MAKGEKDERPKVILVHRTTETASDSYLGHGLLTHMKGFEKCIHNDFSSFVYENVQMKFLLRMS